MAVQAMYALKPIPCFLGGSFMPRGENRVFMFVTVKFLYPASRREDRGKVQQYFHLPL